MAKPKIKKISKDTGTSSSDFITSDNTLKLVGTAKAGSKVTIFIDGKKVGTVKADKKGNWTFKTKKLADGDFKFQVKETKGKKTQKSKKEKVVVDTDTDTPVIAGIADDSGVPGDGITSDRTLALSGTAETGSTVEVFDGGVLLGTVVANAAGAWSFVTAVLSEGAHSFTTRATDVAGNRKSSSAFAAIVDTTAPGAPSTPDLLASSDTGLSDTDDITSDETPTFTGIAEAGSTVGLYANGVEVGSGVATGGVWSITASTLADGTHTITARATDVAGNESAASSALLVTVDTSSPAASITLDPITADNIVNAAEAGGNVAVTGTVGGDVADGDTVTLTVNGSTYNGLVTGGAFSIDVPGSDLVADGDTTVDAGVTTMDAAGNSATANDSQTYGVDTTPPAASITLDPITADNIVNAAEAGGNVAVTGTLGGDVADGDTVTLTVNGNTYNGLVAAGAFLIDVPGSDLVADGDTTVDASVTTTDAAGNSATANDSQTYSVDTTPPTASITLNAITADNIVNAAEAAGNVAVTGTVGGDVADGDTVTLTVNGNTYNGLVAAGAFSIDVPGSDLVADGDTTVDASVTTTDAAGNSTTGNDSQTYSVDTTPPTASITLDDITADNIVNAAEAAGNVAVTGTVGGDVAAGDTVTLTVNGNTYNGLVAAGAFSINVPGSDLVADGDMTVDASVTTSDAAGNSATGNDSQTYSVDTTPPSASITLDAITAEAGNDVDITGTVGGDVADGDTVTLTVNGNTYNGLVSLGAFSISVPAADMAADADMTVDASVTTGDAAGNPATANDSQSYTIVDTTPPPAPSTPDLEAASDTGASDTDNLTNDDTPTFGGTAEAGSTVRLYADGAEVGNTIAVGGSWSITTSSLTDGTYDITARATDAAGNPGPLSAALSVTIDTSPPTASISLDDITPDNIVNAAEAGGNVAITGTVGGDVTDGDTVTLTVNGNAYNGLATAGAFSINVPGSDLAADGDTTVDASVTTMDAAGNSATGNDSQVYSVDTTPPAAPTITGFSDDSGTIGDGLTSDDDLILAGTAEAGATVEVLDGAVSLGTATADGFGDWTLATGLLADGVHSFTAVASDAAGNMGSASGALVVTVSPRTVFDLTFLGPSRGFIIQGDESGDLAGFSVSSAGDVNGDGFDDVIVGVPHGDDGGSVAGEAYVVFGSGSGFGSDVGGRQVIDLTGLTAAEGFIIRGDEGGDRAGRSVSSVGDVNGDGFDDLIVGAAYGDDGGASAGEAYVVFGSGSGFGASVAGRQVIDVTTLTASEGFIVQGDETNDWAGFSVSSAGDVNGDGLDDLIVGATLGDDGGTRSGEAYVVFGAGSGFGTSVAGRQVLDLTSLTASEGFIIQGDESEDQGGWSVSSAGDVNGDGFDDVIVGAVGGDDGGSFSAGEAYVVFGSGSGFGLDISGRQVIDLTSLTASEGFIIQGDEGDDWAGWSVSSAGDVNGDGFDDVIVGAPYGDDGGTRSGEAYVVFGSAVAFGSNVGGRQVIDLASLTASEGFVIQGDEDGDVVGWSVSSAGDVNGDGFDDLIAGAVLGDDGGGDAGEAYVVFGTGSGFGTSVAGRQVMDLSSLTESEGFVVQGDEGGDWAGRSVSSAGDVNGDGFDDLIVGAADGDDGGSVAGEAYVLFGGAFGGSATPVVTNGTGAAEILIGGIGNDQLSGGGGADVIRSGAGDDRIVVSDLTFLKIDGGTGFDILGLDATPLTLDLTDRQLASRIDGIEKIDLTNAGNTLILDQLAVINETPASGNGRHILTVDGDPGDTVEFTEAQWALVGTVVEGATTYDRYVFGNAEVRVEQGITTTFPDVFDLTFLGPNQGFIIQGDEAGDWAGKSVSSAGDVNGDGFDDLIVGAIFGDDGGTSAGEAYVVFGLGSGFGSDVGGRQVIDLTSLAVSQGFIVQGDESPDFAGFSVSSAGDVNGDGFDDLVVGVRLGDDGGTDAGEAYVVFGSGSGFGSDVGGRQVVDLTSLTASEGFIVQGDSGGDEAGFSVSSAGDVNGDGFDDLVVAARAGDDGGSFSAGEAYIVFGSGSGFGSDVGGRQVIDLTSLTASEGFIVQGDEGGDETGWSVSSAGDVNGDGFDDLVVGARLGDDGGTEAGEAYVVFGSGSGFGSDVGGRQVIDLTNLTASEGFIVQGDEGRDSAGFSVSSAGDVNGDGFDDLVIGARNGDDGGAYAGEAYVVFGSGSGFGSDVGGRQVIDLSSLTASEGFIVQGDEGGDSAGYSVSSAGDVNGDGFDDLIVGATLGDDGGDNAGEAYVVFGSGSGFGSDVGGRQVIDLTSLTASEGFIIQGDESGDQAGRSVSSAGDVNGDGYDDLVLGVTTGDDGGADAGEAYVLYGGAFGGSTTPVVTNGNGTAEILIGGIGNDQLSGGGGADVIRSGAGDDLIVVSDLSFLKIDGGTGFDILGLDATPLTLDLTDRQLASRIDGIEKVDLTNAGNTLVVDQLAVINETPASGDGVHILTVDGDPGDTVEFAEAQWALVGTVVDGATTYDRYVYGNAEVRVEQGITTAFPEVFDLTFLGPSQGFIIQGDEGDNVAGYSVSSAGDVNGDGFDDLIVGARGGDDGGTDAGEAYVVFGSGSGFGSDVGGRQVIDLTSLAASAGFIIQGDEGGDEAGFSVSSAGDVNGDGFDDLIVGARLGDDGGMGAGEAYVVFGSGSGFGTDVLGRQVIDLTSLAVAEGFIILGDEGGDRAGWSVSAAGDVNGDGFDDLIIGAAWGDDGGSAAGEAYVVFGGTSPTNLDLTGLSGSKGFVIQGDTGGDQIGRSVSSAGDINGDGFSDLIVGARYGDDGGNYAGEAYVVFGGAAPTNVDLMALGATQGFVIQGDAADDRVGASVSSAGDVNGDGFDDFVVGAFRGSDGGALAGEAYVVFGSVSGFGSDVGGRQVIDLTGFTAAEGFIIQGDEAMDQAGGSVSSAGDVNGDGFDDLIVGASAGDDGGLVAGEAYVVFGTETPANVDLSALNGAQGFVIQGDEAFDLAGYSVSAAGDINNDGFDDLIVGAPFGDDGGNSAGEAYVVYGGAFGGSTTPVVTNGTGAAEILIGGAGDDLLSGGGGADVIRSGAGDDLLTVADQTFRKIDGGSGTDILAFTGTGETIDFTVIADNKIAGIEVLDITGTGGDTIVLGALDIFHFSDTPNADFTGAGSHNNLVILGEAGDTVDFNDFDPGGGAPIYAWAADVTDVALDGTAGGDFDVYNLERGGSVVASVAVDEDITILLGP